MRALEIISSEIMQFTTKCGVVDLENGGTHSELRTEQAIQLSQILQHQEFKLGG